MSLLQPKSSVNGLLAEMIAKFEEEPPLGTRSSAYGNSPNDLLAYVSNLKVNEGLSWMDIQICSCKCWVPLLWIQIMIWSVIALIGVNRPDQEVKVSVIGGGDLGIAAVLSIMAKVTTWFVFCLPEIAYGYVTTFVWPVCIVILSVIELCWQTGFDWHPWEFNQRRHNGFGDFQFTKCWGVKRWFLSLY